YNCDVAVVGGSLAGVSVALTLARAGRSVVLVEPRTYLARDIFAPLRPWLPVPPGTDLGTLPEPIPDCIGASHTALEEGEIPLYPDGVKIRLEDMLLAAGVQLLYASVPVGVVAPGGNLAGVIVANKSGRQVIACRAVVDGTETALVARLAGAQFAPEPAESAVYSVTLEFDQVALGDDVVELPVPARLAVVGDRVRVHRGYRGCGYMLVECGFLLGRSASMPLDVTRREVVAREKAIQVASYLLHEHEAFRLAYLAAVSHELFGPYTTPLAGTTPPCVDPALASYAGPLAGLYCLEAARTPFPGGDPISACRRAGTLARAIAELWPSSAAPAIGASAEEPRPSASAAAPLAVREQTQARPGASLEEIPVEPTTVPILAQVGVLTVGGGTAGAVAAIAAAREGVSTLVVDMNPGLGGTGTYGGVDSYWIGWRHGYFEQVCAWIDREHDRLRHPRLHGITPRWNIEAKTHALLTEAQDAGVELLFHAVAFGALVEGNTVRGVVAATRLGPVALLGDVTIDGTGDGDVAAFAGAEYVYGAARDHAVMWYSLRPIPVPGHTRNNFTSMVDVSDIIDYNRALLAARRRLPGQHYHDHGNYLATRESRHVVGDAWVTLSDHLLRRPWPDVINISLSNNDIKGQTDSDWFRCGLIPPQFEIETPYRALLPKGLENILVIGKAISVSHDALPAVRMQPDFENLGGAAGLAAALAVKAGCTARQVDVRAVQERLVEIGVLPAQVLTRRLVPRSYDDAELQALVEQIVTDRRPLYSYSNQDLHEVWYGRIPFVEVCCAGPRAVAHLEQALAKTEGNARLRVAQALCLVDSKAGVPVLVAELTARLSERLPGRKAFIQQVDEWAPDQGAMPEAAYLLYSLGMARDRRAIPVWQRVVDLLASATEDDVWSQAKGVFYYVDAVCYGAERLGDPEAVPLLRQLHGYAPFHGHHAPIGFQANYFLERAAYLEVVIGRALARCGSTEGLQILVDYLDDTRGILALHPYEQLLTITGEDFGRDKCAWRDWLVHHGSSLKPCPWTQPTDAVASWKETILSLAP
ncbi:MAG: FAD-dependent oxidoreductase, partial [Anaerolineae bacterium]|nr:FAD-dependent oxidoreductase [Anaerolineae bacterium]